MNFTTLTWTTFLIIGGCIILLYMLSNRTRIGRLLIERETPWTPSQWTRILLIVLITCFILVNPVFHLLTFAIFAVLYYILISQNFLSRNIIDLGHTREGLGLLSLPKDTIKLVCTPVVEGTERTHNLSLSKCLFSYPMIVGDEPQIQYENDKFTVELNLISKKYTSSLVSYLSKAGFEVEKIKEQ